jgi:endonuclease/exonuclease/phosphatase family metal-dependent hydrolase
LRAIELPFERQRRVAVAAMVSGTTNDGRPWQLRVVSAHLDNLAPRALWIFASGARARQTRGLLGALPAGDRFSVVGSDLNTWAGGTHEPAYLALRQAFPQTAAPTYRSSGEGGLLLDYIFWRVEGRPAPNVQRMNDTYGSDHHPLVTTVSLDDLVPEQLLPVSRAH